MLAGVFCLGTAAAGQQPLSAASAPKSTVVEQMLSTPKHLAEPTPQVEEDLSLVPTLTLLDHKPNFYSSHQFDELIAKQTTTIKELDLKQEDGFWKILLKQRTDLAGLPVLLGKACRMKDVDRGAFNISVKCIHQSLDKFAVKKAFDSAEQRAKSFWSNYDQQPASFVEQAKGSAAEVAALVQVFAVETTPMRVGMTKYLATVPHAEATRALAKLALFAPEKEVCQAAVQALKGRDGKDVATILLAGLQYQWPEVARRAADTLVALKRVELAPQLADLLDAPDPRLPVTRVVEGKEVLEAKQLVRINHNENCLLCHPPAQSDTPAALSARVINPGVPLDDPDATPYGEPSQSKTPLNKLLVRVDVTYLRQDFSVRQHTQSLGAWPTVQRFDFLVRTVPLTPAQAKVFQEKLASKNGPTPYQQALLTALRGLTGQDAPPTAAAWKKVLKLPG
jgi:hypothetical protein